jgi:eukaryotic-like serine/threonine-protein kinase
MSQDDPTIESAQANEAPFRNASTPAMIGRYQVRRLHGRGGMGEVFLAHDPVLDREVAVKLISGDLESTRSQERLVREARAAGRLKHPNIVTIFDAGEHDGRPFIAMEFVRGETLGSLIRRQAPLSLSRRLELIEGACAGLAHAHRAGVVHFDIKPDNLMLDESGTVKVLDFGIARVLQSGPLVTRQLGGTLRYMSPEQIDNQPLDHRSDVFSLGCALFEMITFVPAFVGSTKDIVSQISGGPMPAPRDVLPGLEPRLDGIVLKAMALDRTQRYSTLDELGAELAAVRKRLAPDYDPRVPTAVSGLDDTPTMLVVPKRGATQTSPSLRRLHSMGRRSWIGTLVLVSLLLGASLFWMLRRSAPAPAPIAVESVTSTPAAEPESPPSEPSPGPAGAVPAPVDDRNNVPRDLPAGSDRTQARESRPPAPDTAPRATGVPEPPTPIAPPVSEEPAATRATSPPESQPPVTAPTNVPAASLPTPTPESPPARPPADEDAVRDTLRRYEAAYRALDVNGLLQIYPSLEGDQADQLRRTFATVTQYDLDIRPSQIDVRADTATVRATLARRITPRVGNPVASEAVTEFRLRRTGGVWSIVGIAAR